MSFISANSVDMIALQMMDRTKKILTKKTLRQHFLRDANAIRRIIGAIPVGKRVLEIGPGSGALTTGLLQRSASLTVVEKDDRLAAWWLEQASAEQKLSVLHADIMHVLDQVITKHDPDWVVGNLPYNISGPLTASLVGLPPFKGMVLMYQHEVAERIQAGPGSRTYGGISVLTRHHYRVSRLLRLPPGAFRPPPKVHSSVLLFEPHGRKPACTFVDLQRTVRQGFAHRRKTVANNFRDLITPGQWDGLGIDPTARPETLDYEAWVHITNELHA